MLHEQQDLQRPSRRAQYQAGGDEADQRNAGDDNIKKLTELPLAKTLRLAEDTDGWRKIVRTSVVPP